MSNKIKFLLVLLIIPRILSAQGQPHFPLKISENRRYFIDQDGKPFLYHADTGWQIFTQLTINEAVEYLSFRKKQGFNTIQVQLVMSPEHVNRYGHKPFLGDNDFSRSDEAYYDHVAKIIAKADSIPFRFENIGKAEHNKLKINGINQPKLTK